MSRVAPRVLVVVWPEGRHLFETTRDARIVVGDDPPDILVLPCSQDRRFERLKAAAVPTALRAARRIVLDASAEATPAKPDIVSSLDETIAHLDLDRSRCVYATANWHFAADYAAQRADPVRVVHYDYWVWESLAHLNGPRAYADRLAAFEARSTERTRTFLSLNRTPRPFKVLLLLRLLRDGLWEQGFISFGGFEQKAPPTLEELPGFEDLAEELAPELERLAAYGCVLLGKGQKQYHATKAGTLPEYGESWFSVVTETKMAPTPQWITEKVLKPLVNFHPFVVFGNPRSLERVRGYGFETFADVIDEAYDLEASPRKRFDLAYAEVRRLAAMSERELGALERHVAARLRRNAQWGLTEFPATYRARIDRALVDQILA